MTPIERAAAALIPYSGTSTNRPMQARKVFESIDVDGLAQVIRDATGRPSDHVACVVYDYLLTDGADQ